MKLTKFYEHLELQVKIKKFANENSDLTKAMIARRFGIGQDLLRKYLRDEPPYPRGYLQTATRTGRPIEEVCENKDKGYHWCRVCQSWAPEEEFGGGGTDISRHLKSYCNKNKKE